MNAISYTELDRCTNPGRVANLHDERGQVAVSMLLDCAPEGGAFREPQPAPLTLAQRIGLELLGYAPYAVVIGFFSVLFALALRTH